MAESISPSSLMSTATQQVASFDLGVTAVQRHFAQSTRSVRLLNFLMSLGRVDQWAVDYGEREQGDTFHIAIFVSELEAFVRENLSVLHKVSHEFAVILSYLTTMRCLYLIQYVGQENENFLERLILLLQGEEAQSSPNIATIKRRLEAVNKAKLLGDIFSGKRLTRISQIMGSYKDDQL